MEAKKLARGSGLFVGETGVEANQHFLIPTDGSTFQGTEGRYEWMCLPSCWGTATRNEYAIGFARARMIALCEIIEEQAKARRIAKGTDSSESKITQEDKANS